MGRIFSRSLRIFIVVSGLLVPALAPAQDPSADASFRVFLRDGTSVVTYGDYARVGDRLIFTMTVGSGSGQSLQVANLPLSTVDLDKTEQYAAAVRSARYAATSGEADYAALSTAVAQALNRITATNEPLERLQIVEQIRGVVATWGRDHYSYRATDVRQIQALLDELVSDLRAQAGVNQFDLDLVANVEPPPPPTLPTPTLTQAIEQVLGVAKVSDVPADRVAILRAVIASLDKPAPGLDREWARRTRDSATELIAAEMRTERAYRDLARTMLTRALKAASEADGPAVEAVLADIRVRDERLGRKRPNEVAGLVATVERHLDSARRLRLARDRWRLQYPALRQYENSVAFTVQQLSRARRSLDAIRSLSGPEPDTLKGVIERLTRAGQLAGRTTAPSLAMEAHATLTSACQLALRAAELRLRAVESGDLQVAWDASAAASGAMMLFDQARARLQAALQVPALP